jgi:hypothetical protein
MSIYCKKNQTKIFQKTKTKCQSEEVTEKGIHLKRKI